MSQDLVKITAPYVIGGILGALGTIGTGFVKEFFDERARRAKHKRNVAREVHALCIEASTGNFRTPARDHEHVNSTMTDLDGVDRKMGVALNRFVTLWGLIIYETQKDKRNASKEDYAYFKGLLDEVQEKRKILVGWANKMRAG
jgi:hypothetical protein